MLKERMSFRFCLYLVSILVVAAGNVYGENAQNSPPQQVLNGDRLQDPLPDFQEIAVKNVAIIGAGAAGSSTAYHLRKFAAKAGIKTNITVFERSSHVGGRSLTINAYNDPSEPVELGASIFVSVNTILVNASKEFGLQAAGAETEADATDMLGIWNGHEFVFTQKEDSWAWWDITKLIWKYGMAPIRTQRLMKKTVASFLKLYERPFFPFRSLTERVYDLGLESTTAITGEELLKQNGISEKFSTDIIQASTRVNYGQNLNLIHGLETMVCMAIEGAMQIKGGNWQIFDRMLKASGANVNLKSTVANIKKLDGGKFSIETTGEKGDFSVINSVHTEFDSVVLAAPLQYSHIDIEHLTKHVPDSIPYVHLHVTLFASPLKLNPMYFNLKPGTLAPTTILTTLSPSDQPSPVQDGVGSAGFFSISTLREATNPQTQQKEYLYKIFSPKAITSEFLSDIFGVPIPKSFQDDIKNPEKPTPEAITWYYPHVFHSYPYEYPRVTFEDPILAKNLYYTSGIESFISTMETSSLMGMNVAQLIVDDITYLEEGGTNEKTMTTKEQNTEL